MGIHTFNPPAPHCLKKGHCRNCPAVPRYWRLDAPAFGPWADSSTVLEWTPAPELQLPSENKYCYWSTSAAFMHLDGLADNYFTVTRWTLGTYASLPYGNLSIDPNVVFDEWVLFGNGAAYSRWPPSPLTGIEVPPGEEFYHFHCLRSNRFWYASADGDIGGEGSPESRGYPPYMTVTPFWP